MYLFEANLNPLANTLPPDVAKHHLGQNLTAFAVDPLVLSREKYPCNSIQVQRCIPTNAGKVKSAMIALAGRTAFLRFYQISG